MLEAVRDKLKSNAQNKIYDKENKETLVEFRDTIIEDLTLALADASAAKALVERVREEEIYSDDFVITKLDGEMTHLEHCIEKLEQMNNKQPKMYRLMDLYRAYKRIIKTYRCVRNIKEYVHRIKEDRVIHDFSVNSQCS